MSSNLNIHVLFRFSKKTGKIDTTMTSMGCALLKMWVLKNCTPTKRCLVIERDTGKVVMAAEGQPSGFPKLLKDEVLANVTCQDFGISMDVLRSIKDDRFDEEA